MELFSKLVNGSKRLTIFAKNSILDVGLGSEYAFAVTIKSLKSVSFHKFIEKEISENVYTFGCISMNGSKKLRA